MARRHRRPSLLPLFRLVRALITVASYTAGSINIKTLVTPEWWTLAPLPLGFVLLAIEFMFRMHRLAWSEVGLRDDAVSAA